MKEVIRWKKGEGSRLYYGKNYHYAYNDELSLMLLVSAQDKVSEINIAFTVKNFKIAKEIVRLLEL